MSKLNLLPLSDNEDKSCILKNRLKKNYQHLKKWAKRTQTDAFRLYDRDIKEHPLAIDYYAGFFVVYYFSSYKGLDHLPDEIVEQVNRALIDLFCIGEEDIFWKARLRREKMQQYEREDSAQRCVEVVEYGASFKVNLSDYLDTGLFLDHRESRQWVRARAAGKSVLNLFSYTASFSVHAALGGAKSTLSVDMSNTYNAWAEENFLLNNLRRKDNQVLREDVMRFLQEAIDDRLAFDIIVIDPPTLSRSKKMLDIFDIQRDYVDLLKQAEQLLHKEGIIFFSTNSRRFKFDPLFFPELAIEDLAPQLLPVDFRDRKIHQCWGLMRKKK